MLTPEIIRSVKEAVYREHFGAGVCSCQIKGLLEALAKQFRDLAGTIEADGWA